MSIQLPISGHPRLNVRLDSPDPLPARLHDVMLHRIQATLFFLGNELASESGDALAQLVERFVLSASANWTVVNCAHIFGAAAWFGGASREGCTRDELKMTIEESEFGRVDILHERDEVGVYGLRIAPGKTIAAHIHEEMDESELILTEGLKLQGKTVAAGTALRWPKGFAHSYHNPTSREQVVLCIDRPRFTREDERGVSGPLPPLSELPEDATERYW